MNLHNSEEKMVSLIKNTYKSIQPAPLVRDRMLNVLLQETPATSSGIFVGRRIPILASSLIVIALILIVYGYYVASQI